MKSIFREAMGYAAASAGALGADMAVLWSLVHFFSWGYLLAAIASFLAGATVAYFLSIHLAFRHHRLVDRRAEFASFVAIGTAGLAVNSLVMWAAVHYLGIFFMTAKCVAAGFTFLCNFAARRQLLFVQPGAAS